MSSADAFAGHFLGAHQSEHPFDGHEQYEAEPDDDIEESKPLQHFFGARVIGTLHEASVWLCGFTIGAAHGLPIESTMNHP